ncbi:hypothetical protein [Actinoplanes aureus]|uniref:Uncharacterized protein n=1 Tax=Actinoplanes aureus TaxID=2792083 RepID=A0A931FYI2_9ACTN|nr:hypothetical protein [Actinoplanes aureus]MBG0563625.1 hypothetical protein [Actinoplanes aureus]
MEDLQETPVDVEVTDGRVLVRAGGIVVIERIGDPAARKHVPIGTRDRRHLTMLVDGVPAVLRPRAGRYTRGSYKVRAIHDGAEYLLRPKDPETSRLHRDGFRLGDFKIVDGVVRVDWEPDARITAKATDLAIGYALAAAFGTGANFFLVMLLDLLGHMPD